MDNEQNTNKKPKRNFLIIYSIALFLFAGILIGLSYLSQARVAHEADKVKQELSDKTQVAAGFEARLEQMTDQKAALEVANAEQKKQIDELTKQVADLTTANATLQNQVKSAVANELLWKLVKADANKKKKECIALIDQIDSQQLRPHFSEEGLKELERIEKRRKGD